MFQSNSKGTSDLLSLQQQVIRSLLPVLSILFALFLFGRWFYYINQYSVNIMFQDQWDLSVHLFYNTSWKDLFFVQHGPHRQGIGFIISDIVLGATDWNTRAEAFAIGGIMVFAGILGVILKRFLTQKFDWTDVIIILFFVSPMHWELFGLTPNPSHGAGPMLLMMLYGLSYLIPVAWVRYPVVLIVNYLLTFTGFGIFMGVVTPVVFLLETIRFVRLKSWIDAVVAGICIPIAALSMWSFFHNYIWMPANPDFVFPLDGWWHKYPGFANCVLANFLGLKIQAVGMVIVQLLGGAFFLTLLTLACIHLWKIVMNFPEKGEDGTAQYSALSPLILAFVTFTLIFVVNSSVGRAGFGYMSSQASRYLAYVIPGALGVYLHFSSFSYSTRLRKVVLPVLLIGMIAATVPMRKSDKTSLRWTHSFKTKWIEVYLETEDIAKADEAAGFAMYPNPQATNMKDKLNKLKKRKQNLFLESDE